MTMRNASGNKRTGAATQGAAKKAKGSGSNKKHKKKNTPDKPEQNSEDGGSVASESPEVTMDNNQNGTSHVGSACLWVSFNIY